MSHSAEELPSLDSDSLSQEPASDSSLMTYYEDFLESGAYGDPVSAANSSIKSNHYVPR